MKGQMYIDGEWVDSATGDCVEVVNPATMEVVGTFPAGNREDIEFAVAAAHKAFPAWAQTTALERSNLLHRAYELLISKTHEIATILTLEQGKPLTEALGEIKFAAEYLRWYAEEAKRVYGDIIPASAANKRIMVIRQPVGVVAAITPWNFPAQMVTRKLAPALAAGCTVVLKPSEHTPLTAYAMFQVFEAAGFPPGVINLVLTNPGDVFGEAVLADKRVRKITFTGSTRVGKYLMQGAASQVKRVSMELGGNAPFIVFDDADLDVAVEACIVSKFRNAGQTCVCANRIYVHDSIFDAFTQKLVERVRRLKVGNGLDEGVEVGPVIHFDALRRIQSVVDDAVANGAEVVLGGAVVQPCACAGAFYAPTILSKVSSSMRICQEETFGPVAPLIPFSSEEEVIEDSNAGEYGLAAYVFTADLERALRVGESLEYGIVGLNDSLPGVVQAPFGGWKSSGVGSEGGYYGMESFLEYKYLSMAMTNRSVGQ
ncbi:NAD-dependent succinate-semialdehyde dehydrogenase [Alicyclobacillus acidoterrestris]|uniref:NAD-dependent succinate-semialdehyde dehydrogenase n=1 Tax=Alicyclobacillus suci TaxID=2816080 RepID=UPI0011958E41|nr:NAD-dependent succinate-semialdehyde dehydrogenase [Alicyclobacillus suci]GEO28073.1 NAD-dependent succinate-semialdehyde dehydrogenase [Alicyclobacillus acidoterrestris]